VSNFERFNAATAVRPWRTPERLPMPRLLSELQCGHGGEAVENSAGPRLRGRVAQA